MADAKTIEIFLPDGDPTGVKIASINTHLPLVIIVPRKGLKPAGSRREFNRAGIYFLIRPPENGAKPLVYVGQAENCFERVQYHNSTKDFWQTAIAVTSLGDKFDNAAIRFLEWHCWSGLRESESFQLENIKQISEPNTKESARADFKSYFESVKLILGVLGYTFFEKTAPTAPSELLYPKSKTIEAQGIYTNTGLTVRKGSQARLVLAESAGVSSIKLRQSLIDAGVLVQKNDKYVFTQNYPFSSPSAAARIVLGRSANGLEEWTYQNGDTLKKRLSKP